MHWRAFLLLIGLFVLVTYASHAQNDCGLVDEVVYPVDETAFSMTQGYAVASPRHQGRFHTGVDFHSGDGQSLSQPVRAIANGRVTYSYHLGWGRDGGVIILEHNLPDGLIVYSMYGHVTPISGSELPPRRACVAAGEVIAAIGDARPAPHLHFEIRVNTPDTPGPGYTREAPDLIGYRDPLRFLANQQAALHPAFDWLLQPAERFVAPPLVLNDGSSLYLDGDTIRRVTADGRVLWRYRLDNPAVSVTAFQGQPLLTFRDGSMQTIDADGNFGDAWRIDATLAGPPLPADRWLLFPTTDNALIAVDETRRGIAWRLEDVPSLADGTIVGRGASWIAGLLTDSRELLAVAGSGALITRTQFQQKASLGSQQNGGLPEALLAYSWGGLWRIGIDGEWSLLLPEAPRGGDPGAMLAEAGRILLFDGEMLNAYDPAGALLWQTAIEDITGRASLHQADGILLLLTTGGDVAAINGAGRLCNQIALYGQPDDTPRTIWHDLGADGRLRLLVGGQLVALDWARFIQSC